MIQKLIYLILLLLLSISNAWSDDTNDPKFLSIADIHFNPFAGCKPSESPCLLITKLRSANFEEWEGIFEKYSEKHIPGPYYNTNYVLLQSALRDLNEINKKEHPQFVLILGDFLAHNFPSQYKQYSHDKSKAGYQTFVKKTLQFLTYKFVQLFPDIDVYPVVGNNDSYTGNYQLIPSGQFFQETAKTWSPLIKNKENHDNFKREFPIAGYYHVSLPTNKHQQIIILNSVLFSVHNNNSKVKVAAFAELSWLKKQLNKPSNTPVLLAYHIPDAFDVYATFKAKFYKLAEFWKSPYSKLFENELEKNSANIKGLLAGHIHIDTYQALSVKKIANIPSDITPSISPIYGNNPAFKMYSYDVHTLELKTVTSYFYPLDTESASSGWQLNSVREL